MRRPTVAVQGTKQLADDIGLKGLDVRDPGAQGTMQAVRIATDRPARRLSCYVLWQIIRMSKDRANALLKIRIVLEAKPLHRLTSQCIPVS